MKMFLRRIWSAFIAFFSSLKLTVTLLCAWMIVIFLGTLSQIDLGVYFAKKAYFDSFFLWSAPIAGFKIPYFLGGATIGLLLILNLTVNLFFRFKFKWSKLGIWFIHIGLLMVLIVGGMGTVISKESQLAVHEGETKSFIQSFTDTELAITQTIAQGREKVISVPLSVVSKMGLVSDPKLPFDIQVQQFFLNSQLLMSPGPGVATQGPGKRIQIQRLDQNKQDPAANVVTVVMTIIAHGKTLGTWLVSTGFEQPQTINLDGISYHMTLRAKRTYLPYQVKLLDFSHDVYAGKMIPKNFSSKIEITDLKGQRSVHEIYMNHPLRYEGHTFYQASFGNNDTLSVLQVVKNGVWWGPYLGSLLMTFGLVLHFGLMVSSRLRRVK